MGESSLDAVANLPGVPAVGATLPGVPNPEMQPGVLEARAAYDNVAGKFREAVRERLELLEHLDLAADASAAQLEAKERDRREHGQECDAPRRVRRLWQVEADLRPRVQAAAEQVHVAVRAARLALQPAAVAAVFAPAALDVAEAFTLLLTARQAEADARRTLEAAGFTAPAPLLADRVFVNVSGENPTARELVAAGAITLEELKVAAPGVQI